MAIPRNLGNLAQGANTSGVLQPSKGGTGLTTVGTNGQVLQSNGTSLTWATPSSGAMTLISTQTISSPVSTLDFTGLSGYNNYNLYFSNVNSSNNGDNIYVLVATGSTTWQTSNVNATVQSVNNSNTPNNGGANNTAYGDISGFVYGVQWNSSDNANGYLVFNGFNSGFYPSCVSFLVAADLTLGTRKASWGRGLFYGSVAQNTGIRIGFQSGNIIAGTFSLYGISS